jgi:cbb3-type cytochrome oxidase subunit 3
LIHSVEGKRAEEAFDVFVLAILFYAGVFGFYQKKK